MDLFVLALIMVSTAASAGREQPAEALGKGAAEITVVRPENNGHMNIIASRLFVEGTYSLRVTTPVADQQLVLEPGRPWKSPRRRVTARRREAESLNCE
jgi:hypothetical protein